VQASYAVCLSFLPNTPRIMRLLLPLLLLLACRPMNRIGADPYRYTIEKNRNTAHAAVVSAHPLASAAGAAVLRAGGNAVDAAITTQLALAVVYPGAGNIGGGGFMVAKLADGRELALDFRETAPAAAHRDFYLDSLGQVIPGLSQHGHRSGGVPGTIAGLFESHRYARLSFRRLLEPAITLAEKGFAITEAEARNLNAIQEALRQYNTRPNAFQKATGWRAGDTLRQPDLAATLRRIHDQGAAGFYEGETARLIVEEMQRGAGVITAGDLRSYQARWRVPQRFQYRGHTLLSMPMPSSGGTLLQQMLTMVAPFRLGEMGHNSPEAIQLMTEAERRAFADRSEYMGDADFYPVPRQALVDSGYLAARMRDYVPGRAGSSASVRPGTFMKTREETTHISIIDADGNAVSVTTTLNNSYGSKTVIGGAGFFLNDEMDDFSIKPGVPNLYGAVGGAANAIAPGKRMLSSMTPTILLKNEKPLLIVGTPGGTTIPTTVFQMVVNLVDFGLEGKEAVNRPRFHHQWLPDLIYLEAGFPEESRRRLAAMGYAVEERAPIGRVEWIRVLPNGRREAVADRRGDDAVAGY